MVHFNQCRLYGVSNKKYLAELLGIDRTLLKDIDYHFKTTPFELHCRNGKTRIVYNPSKEYKRVLKRINYLLQRIELPNYVYGGVKGRNYILNASLHKENSYFLLIDLKDFFPSTNDYFIYKFFKNKLNMSEDIAKIMTLLVSEPSHLEPSKRHLPQGYPTSPLLSYFCYFDMYNGIFEKAQKNSITFSCYYDDFTFSSKNKISNTFRNQIVDLIHSYKLIVNLKKTRFCKNIKGIKITGTIVKKHAINVPNKLQHKMYKNFLRLLEIDNYEQTNKDEINHLIYSIQGSISAMKSIEPYKAHPYIQSKIKKIRHKLNEKGK